MQIDLLSATFTQQMAPPEVARPSSQPTTLELVELLLKQPAAVDRLNRDADVQRHIFPRLLFIAQASYVVYTLVLVLLLHLAPGGIHEHGLWFDFPSAALGDGSALGLVAAYSMGILLAACVCLPSFYFYSLLAGVRLSWMQITSVIGKGTACTAVLLLGVLPIYVAVVLGFIVLDASTSTLRIALQFGLVLPFAVGPWGLCNMYQGIMDLGGALPAEWQCRRRCFFRRLIIAWTAVYSAVLPVMIYRLWQVFAELF